MSIIKQNKPFLKKITIKPQYSCGASCYFCNPRQDLYSKIKKKYKLTLNDWNDLFFEAAELGVKEISISGGEPTLYKPLNELIESIYSQGINVSLNTNGINIINKEKQLIEAGVRNVCFSLYSAKPDVHNQIKGVNNIWERVIDSTKKIVELRNHSFPDLIIGFYFIILPRNYRELIAFYDFAKSQNIDYLFLSYLQGEFSDKTYYLSTKQIIDFKDNIRPTLFNKLDKEHFDVNILKKVNNILSGNEIELAKGKYINNSKVDICNTPNEFIIILPNGDVHACNMVEHSHDGVIGNIMNDSLKNIFYGEKANDFRNSSHDFCQYCSVPLNTIIPLR